MSYDKLKTSIQYIKGVGPKRAERFMKMGIRTVEDLLYLSPRRYIDRNDIKNIIEIKEGDYATIVARIMGIGVRRTKNRKEIINFVVKDNTDAITITFFNRPDLKLKLKPGMKLLLTR